MNKKLIISIVAAIVIIAIIIVIVVIGSRNKQDLSQYAGTYEGQYGKFVGDIEKNETEEFSLELNADGTGMHNRDDSSFKVTWKLDGDNFTMNETFVGDPIEYTGTLKDGKLDIFNGDPNNDLTYEYVYEKKVTNSGNEATTISQIELDSKQYINQLETIRIKGTEDTFMITEKVNFEGATGSFSLSIPYTFTIDGNTYTGKYLMGSSGDPKMIDDQNPKYNIEITNIKNNYETETLITKK